MSDTTRDVRIIAVERLVGRLRAMVKNRMLGTPRQTSSALQLLDELTGKVAALRYSYMEDHDLATFDETNALVEGASVVVGSLETNPGVPEDRRAFLRFFKAVLTHLPESFKGARSVQSLVPIEVGLVQSVDRPPKAKSLLMCRVSVFGVTLPIVTNLVKTRSGDLMKVARVPPAEVMGMLSEAQFVGRADAGTKHGDRATLTDEQAQEVRRAVGEILDS